MNNKIFEWAGVITAILYSLFVALNIGIEFFGFCLLLFSAILIFPESPKELENICETYNSRKICDVW